MNNFLLVINGVLIAGGIATYHYIRHVLVKLDAMTDLVKTATATNDNLVKVVNANADTFKLAIEDTNNRVAKLNLATLFAGKPPNVQ